MPRGGIDKASVDILVMDKDDETVLRIKNQTLSLLEIYALTTMGNDLHVAVVNGDPVVDHARKMLETPGAYAQ